MAPNGSEELPTAAAAWAGPPASFISRREKKKKEKRGQLLASIRLFNSTQVLEERINKS